MARCAWLNHSFLLDVAVDWNTDTDLFDFGKRIVTDQDAAVMTGRKTRMTWGPGLVLRWRGWAPRKWTCQLDRLTYWGVLQAL
jgi:hypothetical protein